MLPHRKQGPLRMGIKAGGISADVRKGQGALVCADPQMNVLSKAHQVWYLQGVSPGGKGQGRDTGTNPTPVLCAGLIHTRLCAPRWRNSLYLSFISYLLLKQQMGKWN